MARAQRSRVPVSWLAAGALVGICSAGCGKPPPANITERLWVSELPTSPRHAISAFVISDVKSRKLGILIQGSVYRATHDLFRWSGDDRGAKGKMKLLQDGVEHSVRTETCEASKGFDHCILLHGDPTGIVRYQSRKRWALRKKDVSDLDFHQIVQVLADEDEDLNALSGAAGIDEG